MDNNEGKHQNTENDTAPSLSENKTVNQGMVSNINNDDSEKEDTASKDKTQPSVEDLPSKDKLLSKELVSKDQPSVDLVSKDQPSVEDLDSKDQSSVDNMVSKDQPLVEDLVSKDQSVDNMVSKDQPLVEDLVSKDQSSVDNMVSKDQPLVEDLVSKDQPSVEDLVTKDQPLVENKVFKDQPLVEDLVSKDQPSAEGLVSKDQPSAEGLVSKDQPSAEGLVSKDQPSVDLVSKDQPSVGDLVCEDQPSLKDMDSKNQPSGDLVSIDQPLVEDLVSKDEPSVEDLVLKDQPSVEDMVSKVQSSDENMVSKDQSSEKDLVSKDQSLVENMVSKDQPSVENLVSKDQPLVKDLDSEDQSSDLVSMGQPLEINQSISGDIVSINEQSLLDENQPLMAADTSDEVPEVTDSLGLLAESSRVMEDDEEQETSEHDDGDDEEDFDPDDESSNQMTAEHSEDSNAQTSESDMPKDKLTYIQTEMLADVQSDVITQDFTEQLDTPEAENVEFNFAITNVVSETALADKDRDMEVDDDIAAADDVEASDIMGDDNDQINQLLEVQDDNEQTNRRLEVEDTVLPEVPSEAEPNVEKDATVGPEDTEENGDEEQNNFIKLRKLLIDKKAEEYFNNKEVNIPKAEGEPTESKESPAKSKESPTKSKESPTKSKESPTKTKKLEISQPKNFVNFVDLEESSSEDATSTDVQEVTKASKPDAETPSEEVTAVDDDVTAVDDDVTNVNIPSQIEIMSSGESISDIVAKEGENVISGVPKPPPHKPARLNTSEVTIKTANSTESTLVVTEAKVTGENSKPKLSLEVFNLDSDEEDSGPVKAPGSPSPEPPKPTNNKCINGVCPSDGSVPYYAADPSAVAYYDASRKRRAMVCEPCALAVAKRAQILVEGIRTLTPLLELDMSRLCEELVEISDSDSEEEPEVTEGVKEPIGVEGARVLEEQLADMINETWDKYKMEERLKDAQDELSAQLERLEVEGKEIDAIFAECQMATDKLRTELYNTFEARKQELPPIVIFDTPDNMFACTESAKLVAEAKGRQSKRSLSSPSETPPKRAAIPLGYAPLDAEHSPEQDTKPVLPAPATSDTSKLDDDKDISVVTLSAEAAPPDLPPPGEITRPPLRAGMQIYAMRNAFGSWLRAKVAECSPKGSTPQSAQFTMCRVKFESKMHKNAYKLLPARCLAYSEPSAVRMTIGTRVIALFKDAMNISKRDSFYSGVVAEVPNPVNNYRYLVFFDDGYAQYVQHADTRLVCEFSPLVWEEVHPFSREFVRQYLLAYPERPMVRLHTGQSLKTEWNGKWWVSRVTQVDASLVQVHFQEDNRTEWIYRGSTRLAPLYLELQAAERHRARPLPRNRVQTKVNMPYVEYTRSDDRPPDSSAPRATGASRSPAHAQEEIRRQRAVAKKSTGASHPAPPLLPSRPAPPPPPQPDPATPNDNFTSRVVYYTPKNAVRPYKFSPHTCGPKCKRNDVLALQDLRTYNPLAKPLLSGWERQLVRYKGHKEVMYRAPCGRRVRGPRELHRYLRAVRSDMGVDLFDFGPATHCLAEFVLNKCIIAKKDLSNGKENVPVPCVNYYDNSLPEFCSYNTQRTPTEGVPLDLDPDFLCGCDCTDDCEDKSKCACWQLTLEGARTIGLDGDVGYVYRRLPDPLPSGIYECNSRCKCKSTCLNRVAQHPLQLKLQIFKTLNRGWGIRALNDVPKGSFLCVYAGNLLTDATANLDGLNEGDEYLAELDYIEVVEQMKEGFEDDIPDADKALDKKESAEQEESDEEMTSSDEDEQSNEKDDGDFEPGFIGFGVTEFNKRLRKRERAKRGKEGKEAAEDNCITISDDEEVREPSRFMAQAGMGANEFISKYSSVRTLFGKDEACYIMDAKVQGNIGRYLNHSCSPNVFVQNVFVDSHDPRFPWVAFFALWPIRAGTELTWNYNYDIGSVPGKVLYCYCGAPNCRGRLL